LFAVCPEGMDGMVNEREETDRLGMDNGWPMCSEDSPLGRGDSY